MWIIDATKLGLDLLNFGGCPTDRAAGSFFGRLVCTRGGISSAAWLGFDVKREPLVATATAIALLVDLFRNDFGFTLLRFDSIASDD